MAPDASLYGGTGINLFYDAFYVLVNSAALIGLIRLPLLFARWPMLRHALGTSVPDSLDVLSHGGSGICFGHCGRILGGSTGWARGEYCVCVHPMWLRAAL